MAGKTSSGGNRESDYGVMVDADGTITVSEAAKLLGYSRTAVDKWIARGCPVAKPAGKGRGNVMRLHLDAVCEWLCIERSADAAMLGDGVCQRSCPPISCGVYDFWGAGFVFRVQPNGSGGLPIARLS